MNLKALRSLAAIATVALTATAANALTLTNVWPSMDQPLEKIEQDPIMLTFDGTASLTSAAWNDFNSRNVSILDANGNVVDKGSLGTAWGADWGKICIYHDVEITDKGVYTCDIPAGIICEDENEANPAPAIHLQWTVGEAGGGGEQNTSFAATLITPESGSTLEKIGKNEIFVWYPGQIMLTDEAWNNNLLNCVRVKDEKGNVVATSEVLWEGYNIPTGQTYFNINFQEDITADGTYTITIPAGIFAEEGKTSPSNEELVLTYTVYNPANNTGFLNLQKVEPAQGEVDALGNIFVYFDKDCDWNWDLDSDAQNFSIYDQNGKAVSTTTFRGVAGGWGTPIYAPFYFPEIEAAGTYTLTIPADRFTVDGDTSIKNKELVFTWTIKDPNQGGGDDDDNCTYDPEFYVSNYPLSGNYDFSYYGSAIDMVLITWSENAVYNPNVKPYIEDANGNRIMSVSFGNFSGQTRVDFNTEDTKVMKTGDYTFVIPKGFGGTSAWKESGYTEGTCNAEARVPFHYVQDPNLDDVNNDFALEVSKFGFYNGETCVVDFLQHPETAPNMTGGSMKKWVFGSNKNEMSMDIYLEVFDVTGGAEEWLWGAGTFRQQVTSVEDVKTINGKNANNEFEVEFSNSKFTLEYYQGHQYEVRIGLYKQFDGIPEAQRICYDTYVARFTGTTKPYEYSPATIVSLSKPEGFDIASATDGQITVTFSEPVTISKNDTYTRLYAGTGMQAYEDVVSNADRTQWTFVPSASSLNGATGTCDYRFQAKDDQGRMLRSDDYYTSGEKANTYITLSYSCFLGGAAISVDVPEGEVNSLYAFTFTAPSASHKNIGFQGMSASGKPVDIVLKDKKGNVVATVDRHDFTATESGEYNIDCRMHLDKEVNAPGEYTLCVPGAYFMTGTESTSMANKPMTFAYTIPGEVVDPEDPSDYVTINFSIGGYAGLGYKTVKNEEATVLIEGSDYWELDKLYLNGENVTEDVDFFGSYTIPASALAKNVTLEAEFTFNHEINFDFTTGIDNVEGCKYTVSTNADGITIDGVSVGDQIKVFSTNGMLLAEREATNEKVTISVPNGTYIVLINNVAIKVLK